MCITMCQDCFSKIKNQDPEIVLSEADQKGFEQCISLKWSHADVAEDHQSNIGMLDRKQH